MHIIQLPYTAAQQATVGWADTHPTHFAATFSTVAADDTAIHLGIIRDRDLLCVVTLRPAGKGIYELHLAVKRGQAVTELLPAFFSIREQLFNQLGVKELSGWVPRLHVGIKRVAHSVGFRESGASLLQLTGTRLTEWQQLILKVN